MALGSGERVSAGLLTVGFGGVGWLGWVESGSVVRNSYEMFRSAQRLGLDVLTPLRVVWFLVPVASLLVLVFVALGFGRGALSILGAQALLVGGAGVAVTVAGVGGGPGAIVAMSLAVGAIVLIATSIVRSRLAASSLSSTGGDASMPLG